MASIDRIVRVTIALRTAGVRQQTFSDLMLLGVHTGPDRVGVITEADELLDAGSYNLANTTPLYKAAQIAFSQNPGPRRIYIGRRGGAETVQTALAACAADNGAWYGFSEVSHAGADVMGAAAWAEANQRLYLTTLSAPETVTSATGDTASSLQSANYFHTAWWYHPDAAEFPEVATAASAFTTLPGGEVWSERTLAGVTVTALNEGQYLNVKAKNGNTFETFRNYNLTQIGLTAGGEWIDIIRFRDWLIEEIRTSVFNAFVNNRIPYTDMGIAVIRERIIIALELGIRRGGIAPPEVDQATNRVIPSYTVTVPRAADISNSDKAARLLRDVKFTARLAGAITATEIEGILTYDSISAET